MGASARRGSGPGCPAVAGVKRLDRIRCVQSDLSRMATVTANQSVTTRFVGPGDGEYAAFQPGSAMAMGYDELKVIEAHRFLQSIETGSPVGATIWDAVAAAQLIEAIAESARTGSWVAPKRAD